MVARPTPGGKSPLSVSLQDVPNEGLHMDCAVSSALLDLHADEGRVVGTFHWVGDVIKTSDGASATGTLSGIVVRECVRCLQEFKENISIPCKAAFQQDPKVGGQEIQGVKERVECSEEGFADDIYPCVDDRVELDTILREQVILATPIQPLCREDCLGLCQQCGRNLNQEQCRCVDRDPLSFQKFPLHKWVK